MLRALNIFFAILTFSYFEIAFSKIYIGAALGIKSTAYKFDNITDITGEPITASAKSYTQTHYMGKGIFNTNSVTRDIAAPNGINVPQNALYLKEKNTAIINALAQSYMYDPIQNGTGTSALYKYFSTRNLLLNAKINQTTDFGNSLALVSSFNENLSAGASSLTNTVRGFGSLILSKIQTMMAAKGILTVAADGSVTIDDLSKLNLVLNCKSDRCVDSTSSVFMEDNVIGYKPDFEAELLQYVENSLDQITSVRPTTPINPNPGGNEGGETITPEPIIATLTSSEKLELANIESSKTGAGLLTNIIFGYKIEDINPKMFVAFEGIFKYGAAPSKKSGSLEVGKSYGLDVVARLGLKGEAVRPDLYLNLGLGFMDSDISFKGHYVEVEKQSYNKPNILIGLGLESLIKPNLGVFLEGNYYIPLGKKDLDVIGLQSADKAKINNFKLTSFEIKVGVRKYF